jgi:hypothetical protein
MRPRVVGLEFKRPFKKREGLSYTFRHGPHHSLEHMAQEVAVAEAAVSFDRECRVIWHFVVKIEAAKPAP